MEVASRSFDVSLSLWYTRQTSSSPPSSFLPATPFYFLSWVASLYYNLCQLHILLSTGQKICSQKGSLTKCSLHEKAMLRTSNCSSLKGVSCIPSKHIGMPWRYCLQEGLSQQHFGYKQHIQHKVPRHIRVRSELAGTGIPSSRFSLSEIKLGSKVRGMCFYATTAVTAIFLFVLMVVQHPFVHLLDRYRRRAHHFVATMWATITVTPFFKIKFEGMENLPPPDTPAVYVSNHQSFLDIYTLLTLGRSFKFISKTAIFLYPIIGWAMFMLGFIPLKRMDSRSQLDCLKRCIDLVNKGASVLFFPEGTRSKDGNLCAFKKGAFSVAAKTGVPVVPMTLVGTGKIMPAGRESILNIGSVKVVIHKPLEGHDPTVLCNEARNAIASAI